MDPICRTGGIYPQYLLDLLKPPSPTHTPKTKHMSSIIAQLEQLLTPYGLTVYDLPKIAASLTLVFLMLLWRSIKPYKVPKGVPQLPSKPFVGCLPL